MTRPLLLVLLLPLTFQAQDSSYARKVITELCQKKYFGRGYLHSGLAKAEKFICDQLQELGATPYLSSGYTLPFMHPVNTFPQVCILKINGQRLEAGKDFIPHPSSGSFRGKCRLEKIDSVTYADARRGLVVKVKKKLTFSVAHLQSNQCQIEVLQSSLRDEPGSAKIKVKNRLVPVFESRNILAEIKGTSESDSLLVFTAHYDHLGGIGKKVFFPGANDNASGVSMVLNLVKYYAAHPHRYKTVFIFFAGEEAGLLGSEYLVSSNLIPLHKIRFLINLDLLGTGDEGIMVVNGSVHQEHFSKLKTINDSLSLVKEIRSRGKAANSDHYHFSEAGVPSFFIYTLGGRTAYHDVYDTAEGLPLTDYNDVLKLLLTFAAQL